MKKMITLLAICAFGFANAQAYKGKGDVKAQVGLNVQSGGTGINVAADFGLGANISLGLSATYLLDADAFPYYENFTIKNDSPSFIDKFDLKARFNANIGNVLQLPANMDVYPGLDLGLRNFGTHVGFRYFFTDGFGLYGEAGLPLAKYDTTPVGVEHYNNQFYVNVGASFNI